jgi:BlaI family transcriptional regulator, penicillinase repressor
MARPFSDLLTAREAQIMEILWQRGPSTAEMVREELPDQPHDSTVRTLLRILKEKGYVGICGQRPAVYEAMMGRVQVQKNATQSLLARFFGGSAEALMHRLVEDEELTPDQLEQWRRTFAKRKTKGDRS